MPHGALAAPFTVKLTLESYRDARDRELQARRKGKRLQCRPDATRL